MQALSASDALGLLLIAVMTLPVAFAICLRLPELVALADTVSEVHPVKHAYEQGIGGQTGIEY